MIPLNDIIEWSDFAPWSSSEQVEQDLVVSRSLVELFNDNLISENLAFRGGTAIHKLFFSTQPRYSEDIDLVQIIPGPFGNIIDRIREILAFIGDPRREQKERSNTLIYRFDSEDEPVQRLKLKVETNCREHHSLFDLEQKHFEVKSSWFNGTCKIPTYQIEELLGTKLRALYQRKKGRDLYDIHKVLSSDLDVSVDKIIQSYHFYMKDEPRGIPDSKTYIANIDFKLKDPEFLSDTALILHPSEEYDPGKAYDTLKDLLFSKL
jgi:predicted nucleotidyltransferase component of viral defense system